MQILSRWVLSFLLVAAGAAPVWAGIHYRAETRVEGDGQKQRTVVEGWVEGGKAKILFHEADTPVTRQGTYLLTSDGGETLYLVDPEEKTYTEWDLEALLQTFGAVMESMGPMLNLRIDNVEVARLGQEDGPAMHGLPTTHTTYRTEYDMTIKVMGMSRANHVESTQEVWSTTALDAAGLGVWLRNVPTTGFEDLDELVAAEMGQVQGFPLKAVTTAVTTGQKGKRSTTSTTTMEVTSLDTSASIPDSTFALPEGYTRTEMTGGEDDNPLGRIFGGGRS
ncbi:MAG TPA: DUF4412 domain-containing protein [Thermoanaerobaculia bacterium]|nr:DUF4412 domain-containing protein [Thermoanaerobaculia bacterium]